MGAQTIRESRVGVHRRQQRNQMKEKSKQNRWMFNKLGTVSLWQMTKEHMAGATGSHEQKAACLST